MLVLENRGNNLLCIKTLWVFKEKSSQSVQNVKDLYSEEHESG